MRHCPKCGSPRVYRSRTRGVAEKLRKNLTLDRPHRCHACEWRGWGPVTEDHSRERVSADRRRPEPDLSAIDVIVEPDDDSKADKPKK